VNDECGLSKTKAEYKSDLRESVNPLYFRCKKKLSDSDNIQIQIQTPYQA